MKMGDFGLFVACWGDKCFIARVCVWCWGGKCFTARLALGEFCTGTGGVRGLLLAVAGKNSPSKSKMRQIGPFWASRASFVPELVVCGACWRQKLCGARYGVVVCSKVRRPRDVLLLASLGGMPLALWGASSG